MASQLHMRGPVRVCTKEEEDDDPGSVDRCAETQK